MRKQNGSVLSLESISVIQDFHIYSLQFPVQYQLTMDLAALWYLRCLLLIVGWCLLNFSMELIVLRMEGLCDPDRCGSNMRSYWWEDHGVEGGQFLLIIICSLYFTKRCCVFASARTSLCGMGCLKSDDCSIYHQLSHHFLCTAATAAAH